MKHIQLTHRQHVPVGNKYPLCFLAHDMDMPSNVGSLFRIADALGIEKLYLSGNTLAPPNSKLNKAARSAEKYVEFEYEENPLNIINTIKARGYQIVSLELTSMSVDLETFRPLKNSKICLILGAENKGVCQTLLDASDHIVHIPMMGINSSMNVANACAIAAYHLRNKIDPNVA